MTPERLAEILSWADFTRSDGNEEVALAIHDLLYERDSLITEIATLRTQRDALVTAGEKVVNGACVLMETDRLGNRYESGHARCGLKDVESLRAALAAVTQAKGEK